MIRSEVHNLGKGKYRLTFDVDMIEEQDEDGISGFCTYGPFTHPWLHLCLSVSENDDKYYLRIAVFDYDDYDIDKEYECNAGNYRQKTHELINWMIDQHFRSVDCSDPYKEDFFPEI